MGKTRYLFKKIRDTKGTFHAKMGSIKDRNGMDLTQAEDIKKMWQEYTELYKKRSSNWERVPNQERSMSNLYIVTLLFNLYAEYIMRNAGLDEAQAGIKIAGRNINNLR